MLFFEILTIPDSSFSNAQHQGRKQNPGQKTPPGCQDLCMGIKTPNLRQGRWCWSEDCLRIHR